MGVEVDKLEQSIHWNFHYHLEEQNTEAEYESRDIKEKLNLSLKWLIFTEHAYSGG